MLKHVLLFTSLVACATDPNLEESVEEIKSSSAQPASQFQLDRALRRTGGCMTTRISQRFAISAAHCQPGIGNTVSPYAAGPGSVPGAFIDVVDVIFRPGVDPAACYDHSDNCWDSNGWFADIALLELSATNEDDLEGPAAVLAWKYPGVTFGQKVGAGRHDQMDNPDGILLQAADFTADATDTDGEFYTILDQTDKGDSGGPFYVANRVVGTLWGNRDGQNRYTSVPRHLHWILTNIAWRWRGQPSQTSTAYTGTLIDTFPGSELVCQYACENTSSCEAYSIDPGSTCRLYDNPTAITASGYRGAYKFGARSGNSNQTVGYVRANGVTSVVNVSSDSRIDELALTSTGWAVSDIHGAAPLAASKVSAYRRSDGVPAIVYRSTTGRLIELAKTGASWQHFDLTTFTNAEAPSGNPVAYLRADGVSAIVYRGATTQHIIELRLGSQGMWLAGDLTAASGANVVASSDPSAAVRSDGRNSITFRSGDHIWELYQESGGLWVWGVPSQLAAGAPSATSRPFGYTHSDGTNAIVYRSKTNAIIELYLIDGQWHWGQIGSGATQDPTAYVRTDGVESVLFRNTDGHLVELTNNGGWQAWNLSTVTGAPVVATGPAVYHRYDGYNIVLAKSGTNHVIEHAYKRGGTWNDYNLTTVTGETP
jgi:hypothetical protein